MIEKIIIENRKGFICEFEGCELPAVRKVRAATGSEHWYCSWHAKLIERGH